jgi:hypothetical protein
MVMEISYVMLLQTLTRIDQNTRTYAVREVGLVYDVSGSDTY